MLSSSSKFILKLKGKKVIGSTSLSNTFRSSYNFKVAFSTFSKPGNSQSNHLSTLHVLSKHKVEDFDLRDFDTFPRRMKNSPLKESPLIQSGEALFGNRNDSWWTGKLPKSCTYIDGQAHSLPFLSLEKGKCDKFTLQAYFDNTWTLTESLFAGLQGEEAYMVSPEHNLRHPLIFYYGHPAVLYINKLRVAGLLKDPINPYFEAIFETGVDEMSWDDMSKNKLPWPSVSEVHQYRKKVYTTVSDLISSLADDECSNINMQSPLWALAMSFEHERIHIETSSVLISELPLKYVRFPVNHMPPYFPYQKNSPTDPQAGIDYPINKMIEVEEKSITLGKPETTPSFGWDNEYGHRMFEVPAFRASEFKITNGEYLEFVKDGGYAASQFWSEVGWKWRSYKNAKWPYFWRNVGPQGLHQFELRVLYDAVPMQWDWPVVVNFHEADAFANWRANKTGKRVRVMSELEHNAIRDEETKVDVAQAYSKAHSMADALGVNSNLSFSSMTPVNAFPANKLGFHDVFGNAWEWNIDFFSPLPGFEVNRLYEDFSTPCFDGLHHVIQGSSFMSTGNEASVYSRYHFRPHFLQHASFRLVEQLSERLVTSDTDSPGPYVGSYPFRIFESKMRDNQTSVYKPSRAEVLDKYFGNISNSRFGSLINNVSALTSYHKIADLVANVYVNQTKQPLSSASVIDVGCGAGGLTLSLASRVKVAMGMDHDSENISLARDVAANNIDSYQFNTGGNLSAPTKLNHERVGDKSLVDFRQADPMCLPAELHGFDIVVLNDVIDKVSAPNSVLGRLVGARGLLCPGGLLAVMSAYNWDANCTPRSLWLGDSKDHQSESHQSPSKCLQERLSGEFDFISEHEVPLLWQNSPSQLSGKVYTLSLFSRKL